MKKFLFCFVMTIVFFASNSVIYASPWVITYTSESDQGILEYAVDVNNYRVLKNGDYICFIRMIDYDENYTERCMFTWKHVIRRNTHTVIRTETEFYLIDVTTGKLKPYPYPVKAEPVKIDYYEKGYEYVVDTIRFLDNLVRKEG